MTRTASPGLKRGSATPLDLRHLARQLLGRNDAALEERLGQRDDPALVVAQLVVGLRGQRLDVPAPLVDGDALAAHQHGEGDRKSTRLNSSHTVISYAVFCLKKKKKISDLVSRESSLDNT